MKVLVKDPSGSSFEVVVSENDDVEKIRDALFECQGVPMKMSRIQFDGQTLKSGKSLSSYGVVDGSQVDLYVGLRGGWQTDPISLIAPIIFTVIFVGCAVAGPILVVQQVQANQFFSVIWWVGIALCITAGCLLIILIPCWIYVLCCD